MRRLVNASRGYDWGSAAEIPRFLGVEPNGQPVAEVWIGTHPLAPSTDADGVPLSDGTWDAIAETAMVSMPRRRRARHLMHLSGPTRIRTTSQRWRTR